MQSCFIRPGVCRCAQHGRPSLPGAPPVLPAVQPAPALALCSAPCCRSGCHSPAESRSQSLAAPQMWNATQPARIVCCWIETMPRHGEASRLRQRCTRRPTAHHYCCASRCCNKLGQNVKQEREGAAMDIRVCELVLAFLEQLWLRWAFGTPCWQRDSDEKLVSSKRARDACAQWYTYITDSVVVPLKFVWRVVVRPTSTFRT